MPITPALRRCNPRSYTRDPSTEAGDRSKFKASQSYRLRNQTKQKETNKTVRSWVCFTGTDEFSPGPL